MSVKDSAGLPALRRLFAVKHKFFCALLFVFPLIAKLFILINAVIQQVVRELPPLDSSSSLLHELLLMFPYGFPAALHNPKILSKD